MNSLIAALADLAAEAIPWRLWIQPAPYPGWVLRQMIEQEPNDEPTE